MHEESKFTLAIINSLLTGQHMLHAKLGLYLDGEAGAGIVLACNAGCHAVVPRAQAVDLRLGVAQPLVLRKQGLHMVGGVPECPAPSATRLKEMISNQHVTKESATVLAPLTDTTVLQ